MATTFSGHMTLVVYAYGGQLVRCVAIMSYYSSFARQGLALLTKKKQGHTDIS